MEIEVLTLSSHQAQEEYGEWSKELQSELVSFDKENFSGSTTFSISKEVFDKIEDECYAVVVTHDSGDTFGHSTGHIDVAVITPDLELAQQAAEAIKIQFTEDRYVYPPKKKTSFPWEEFKKAHPGITRGYDYFGGYFESVTGIDVQKITTRARMGRWKYL